jgi:hypothetical protein
MSDKRNHKLEYNCLMLKFEMPNWSDFVSNLIDANDVYNNDENSYGLEYEPHVTLLFGIHDYVGSDIFKNILVPIRHIKCKAPKISIFENKDFDVVKFDIDGNYLHKINHDLRSNVDYTTSYPEYHPHMTIGYVKPGTGKKYKKRLKNPLLITPTEYIYSKTDGTKENFFV